VMRNYGYMGAWVLLCQLDHLQFDRFTKKIVRSNTLACTFVWGVWLVWMRVRDLLCVE